jgi:8-oxo-dGTP diphosphatase
VELRAVTRTIIYHLTNQKVLLAKNVGQDFWYPPGGGWEYHTGESIVECAKREVLEETGIEVEIKKLLYAQQYQYKNKHIQIETFWLATVNEDHSQIHSHKDLDPQGFVEKVRWFNREEIKKEKVFPEILKYRFWDNIQGYLIEDNRFLGIQKEE